MEAEANAGLHLIPQITYEEEIAMEGVPANTSDVHMEINGNEEAVRSIGQSMRRQIDQLSEPQKQPSIYKVHKHLRNINDKAYEPQIIAIGPYHHDKSKLKKMEEHKTRYLKILLQRKKENVERYISAVAEMEQDARNFYAENISLDAAKFIEMLVLDGCFIIELISKYDSKDSTCDNDPSEDSTCDDDPIFQTAWMRFSLNRDLILFENQIPFFVLCKLFDLIEGPNQHNILIDRVIRFCESVYPGSVVHKNSTDWRSDEVRHMLDLLYRNWRPSSEKGVHSDGESNCCHLQNLCNRRPSSDDQVHNVDSHGESRVIDCRHLLYLCNQCPSSDGPVHAERESRRINCGHLLERLCKWRPSSDDPIPEHGHSEMFFIHTATKLTQANVKFQVRKSDSLFYVDFNEGIMLMPPLRIDDTTECFFRNLIAYEQYFPPDGTSFVADYALVLDCLINTWRDVEILSHSGIIFNELGDNQVVANIFNKITDSVVFGGDFAYGKTFLRINTHYKKRWNRACAVLNRVYFNSPWAYFSFFAALLLLLLTAAQTVFSALQVD